ncbi:P-loop containing nucleoside triphosphate hydrolase protein [Scleroderma citrinum]
MRLHSLIPIIPTNLVSALEDCGIKIDTDLLFFDGTNVELLAKLPPGIVSLRELEEYTSLVAEHASAPAIRADQELEVALLRQRENALNISCGVQELDALVEGFGGGRVFEISGEKGSGKTALALQISLCMLAAHANTAVLWMDTCGDFSLERTLRVASELNIEEATSTVLERLQVSLVLNIETAQNLVSELCSSTASELGAPRIRCIVIDSITPLLAPSLTAFSAQGHATMSTFMRELRDLARTHYFTFLVVNNTSSYLPHNPDSAFASTTRKPALGPSFTFLTDCTLWLAKSKNIEETEGATSMHVAEVFRSRMTQSKRWCSFKIHRGVLYSTT